MVVWCFGIVLLVRDGCLYFVCCRLLGCVFCLCMLFALIVVCFAFIIVLIIYLLFDVLNLFVSWFGLIVLMYRRFVGLLFRGLPRVIFRWGGLLFALFWCLYNLLILGFSDLSVVCLLC